MNANIFFIVKFIERLDNAGEITLKGDICNIDEYIVPERIGYEIVNIKYAYCLYAHISKKFPHGDLSKTPDTDVNNRVRILRHVEIFSRGYMKRCINNNSYLRKIITSSDVKVDIKHTSFNFVQNTYNIRLTKKNGRRCYWREILRKCR